METSTLVELVLVVVIGATLAATLDVTTGIEIVDRAIDLLDVRQYL